MITEHQEYVYMEKKGVEKNISQATKENRRI